MVTIRNDIESNGNANRSADSSVSVVEGSKNVNHLANGSRRSTMGEIKAKAFNRKCVGFLALIVCVGVCFGVGMLFLYGHLVERLNESASHGSMLHDKNGNPVMHHTTAVPVTTSTVTVPSTTELATSTSAPTTTEHASTKEDSLHATTEAKREEELFDLDSDLLRGEKRNETVLHETERAPWGKPTDKGSEPHAKHREKGSGAHFLSSGSGDYVDDEGGDDEEPNREGSGGRIRKV